MGGLHAGVAGADSTYLKGGTMACRYLLPVHRHVQAEWITDAVPYAYIHPQPFSYVTEPLGVAVWE